MNVIADLLDLSDHVFERTSGRLDGLTDDEYFWEPVAESWSVRIDEDGVVTADWAPTPDIAPVTTVAWRVWHLTECYGAGRNEQWLLGTTNDDTARCAPRPTAAAAIEGLEAAHAWWRSILADFTDTQAAEPLGPIAGPYAESTKASFILHQLDEMIHHAAEIALLRDLYRTHNRADFRP